MEPSKIYWRGSKPTTCWICGAWLLAKKYFVDAPVDGHWGLICPQCHKDYCLGRLGTGLGQAYDSHTMQKIGG